MAPVIRVNSVAVSTAQISAVGKRLQPDDVAKMLIENDFGAEKLAGIQYLPHRQIVVIKFKKKDDYEKFLKLEAVKIAGMTCKLFDLSSQFTTVTIMGAPFEMEKDDIVQLLAYYGDVKQVRQRLLACEKNRTFNAIPDGTWIAIIDIKKNIPSYITINDFQLFIRYNGQTKTCRICSSSDHIAKDCRNAQKTDDIQKKNEEFPTLQEANQTNENEQQQPANTQKTTNDNNEQKETNDIPVETPHKEPTMAPPSTKIPRKAARAILPPESPSTKSASKAQRPVKKRRKTPVKITTTEEDHIDSDTTMEEPLPFIDLDKNYIVTIGQHIGSDDET